MCSLLFIVARPPGDLNMHARLIRYRGLPVEPERQATGDASLISHDVTARRAS